MKTGNRFKGDILKDGEVLFKDQRIELLDEGEYQTLGSPGYWFQLTLEDPVTLERGDKCELTCDQGRFQIDVARVVDAGLLTFLTFNFRQQWNASRERWYSISYSQNGN